MHSFIHALTHSFQSQIHSEYYVPGMDSGLFYTGRLVKVAPRR